MHTVSSRGHLANVRRGTLIRGSVGGDSESKRSMFREFESFIVAEFSGCSPRLQAVFLSLSHPSYDYYEFHNFFSFAPDFDLSRSVRLVLL